MKGNFNTLVNSEQPVLVDFYADWCGPCKMLAPILQDVAKEMAGKARILKIDVDKNQELASRFQVRGVPTMILFRRGEILWRTSGVLDKKAIVDKINNAM
ncbi:thioredoxin [Zeaxanthinibacter enoshimensis]|uniref:Thioredoxin n=1 Tax=Zeaxanthinibacter enoshimensis TaxID=392009 RepID=A0A4R6TNC6_9FLAO|nr:thioredoxin [Zeaxanthinibacter enoshimensis]TDQ32755.1 thioredoxin 1 [Zeaxanthinibacter enoshimensis]